MSQINTSSNYPSESKALASISQLPLIQNDFTEDFSAQKPLNLYNFSKNATKSNNSKRLANILESKEDSKASSTNSLSKTFNLAMFHSPSQMSSPQNQSIRQKIGNMKPVTPSHVTSKDDDESMKNIDFSKLAKSRVVKDSSSPQAENGLYSKNASEIFLPKPNPHEESRQEKIRQINAAYKVQNPMRVSRSYLNTSNSSIPRAYSHSPTSNHNFGSPSIASQSNKIFGISTAFTPSNIVTSTLTNTLSDKGITANPHQRGQSFSEAAQIDKGMLFLRKQFRPNSASKDFQLIYPLGEKQAHSKDTENGFSNSSANVSLLINGKETDANSKNDNFSMEHVGGAYPSSNLFGNAQWDNDQSQLGRGEYLENRIEKLLVNKSIEPQYLEEISIIFDSFVETIQDNRINEGSKVRSTLHKIKLAYELFFQNYSVNQEKRLNESRDNQVKLQKEAQKMSSKLKEMNTEIEILRKENERVAAQNKIYRSNQSPTSSLAITSKQQPISTEDTPPGNKSSVPQIEAYKLIIAEQQNAINSMKKKEAKMIKLLYACKKRGLDLEQVYNEEIKANQDQSIQDEEELSSMSKGSKSIQLHHKSNPQLQLHILQQKNYEYNQSTSKYPDNSDRIDSLSIADSDAYEMEQYEIHNQPQVDNNSKLAADPALKNKLKLDFSQLGIPKTKVPTQVISQEQKPNVSQNTKELGAAKQKVQPPTLNLQNIKEQQEKAKGYHEEFMSKIDEFSASWRHAALNERKIP